MAIVPLERPPTTKPCEKVKKRRFSPDVQELMRQKTNCNSLIQSTSKLPSVVSLVKNSIAKKYNPAPGRTRKSAGSVPRQRPLADESHD